MKRLLLVLGAAASLAACATNRPHDVVHVGDTTDKVRAVYGKPDRQYRRQTSAGELEAWGYMPYWLGFGLPTEPIGSRGSLSSDIPLEQIREDEDVRVFFRDGKVVGIEYRANK